LEPNSWRDRIYISPYCNLQEVTNIFNNGDPLIDDSTLREGEQTAGVVFSLEDKIRIAELLSEIQVDRIEAGFPASSEAERKEVKTLANMRIGPSIYGFARAVEKDIDAVVQCDCEGIVLSFPPSDIHIKYKLGISREEYLERAVKAVEYAKAHGLNIVYSAEDSTRTELSWLKKVFTEVIGAGVNGLRIVDTLGCITPTAMRYLVREIKKSFSRPIEVHCHNDHGLSLANSLAAYEGGATCFSTSVLGIGERAGITATEEMIVALHNFYGVEKYDLGKLCELCSLVSELTRIRIWPTKPLVGENVFAHTSGIHQDGVLKNPIVYECFPPEMIRRRRRFLLSRISGTAAVKAKLRDYGIDASDEDVIALTNIVKEVSANRRSPLREEDFLRIVQQFFLKTGSNLRLINDKSLRVL